ncbi:MAG: acyl-CoA dehydratase activase [Oscillospiraceae bacterium]|nr:acyl-CoA dehydratase activase [Oscillospiraceae bacterium]
MIIAGIDVGVENTKVVIIDDKKVVGCAAVSTGGVERPTQIRKAYEMALSAAGISEKDVGAVIATGRGKFDVDFVSGRVTETIAATFAARFLYPDATSVMSVGADETLAATIGKERLVGEYVANQKCTAALGTFLKFLAKRLGVALEECKPEAKDAGEINEGCVVFSELDALSLINDGAKPEAVMASAINATAIRAATVMNDLTIPKNERPILIGGLAKNAAFVSALEKVLGFKFIIPENPEFCGAIGAAVSGGKVA